jgi:predicted metal-dependent enzyme (double-stranded beta helix superfamily)
LIAAIKSATHQHADWQQTAELVAGQLAGHLPPPDLLSAAEREGHADDYQSHVLHVEPDGSFSVTAMVWRPGQVTPVHDHVSWCVFGVIQGIEYEELFALTPDGSQLVEVGRNQNQLGSVSGFAPPGDIHRVRNIGDTIAISLHVYGADITRLGSSIRRRYDLPVAVHAAS